MAKDSMPGSGTDHTRDWIDVPGPVVVLVGPQMGENIGAAARAMANFGLTRMRIVSPVQGWPNDKARMMAAGADNILENAEIFDSAEAAVADCRYVIAATARVHAQAKPVLGPRDAVAAMTPHIEVGAVTALMFGRERNGLQAHEVALADAIVTLPVNPAFASLNLAQAVVILAYEWYSHARDSALPFSAQDRSPPAPKQQLSAFFATLERELERVEFFRPEEKRETMAINLRNIVTRMQPSEQDMRTLHGVIQALVSGRKGPAKGGVLDSEQAQMLRAMIAEHGGQTPKERAPVRGLARLLRRNPTDAERILWHALVNDKRFAGQGFKRQTPIGQHIADFVSFPLRMVIDVLPGSEEPGSTKQRDERQTWLQERGYRLHPVRAEALVANIDEELDRLAEVITAATAPP